MTAAPPPLNIAQLNRRLNEVSGNLGIPTARIRRMLCTLVVSQMLPDPVVIKGGMGSRRFAYDAAREWLHQVITSIEQDG